MKAYNGLVLAAVLSATLLWGSSFIALKTVLQTCDADFVIFGRLFLAALCALPLYKHFKNIPYEKGDWRLLFLLGLCEPCLYFIFESKALMLTTSGQAGMITALMPAMVAMGAWLLFRENMNVRIASGFFMALAGVFILTWAGEATATAPDPIRGNFYEFLAMVTATGYVLVLKKLSSRYSPLFLTTVQSVTGALFFGVRVLISPVPLPVDLPALSWWIIAYLGMGVSFGAYFSYNFAVSRMPASQAAAFINLIPVISLGLGRIFLGETLTLIQFGAAALILFGVYLSQERPA